MDTTTTTEAPTAGEPAPTGRRVSRRLKLGLAAAAIAATGVGAVGIEAASADTLRCYGVAKRQATFNVLGQITHGVTNEVRWCVSTSTGRIASVQTRASHQEAYLWNWVGWNGNTKSGGVGSTGFTYRIEGSFKECAAYCFHGRRDWVKLSVYANGTYSASGGSY